VAYANSNCNGGQGLAAEFVSRAMSAGGAGNPVITWVPDLVKVLLLLLLLLLMLHLHTSPCSG
jgi:hypothetical protein